MNISPGPWFVGKKDRSGNRILGTQGGYDGVVAARIENVANARLIASAPDLLAALERMVKGAECTCEDGGPGFICDVCEARAAIKKAKGE